MSETCTTGSHADTQPPNHFPFADPGKCKYKKVVTEDGTTFNLPPEDLRSPGLLSQVGDAAAYEEWLPDQELEERQDARFLACIQRINKMRERLRIGLQHAKTIAE